MNEQMIEHIKETSQNEPEKKPNPYWIKINKMDEEIKNIARKIEIIEKSLRRGK